MWRVRAQTEESRHKLPVSVIFSKNEGGRRVSTQFRDIQKVRVRLTSSRPKWPMWPSRAQTGESRHKLDLSVILMENEEGGRVSTHFRDSEKVRVRLTSSGPKRRMWRVRAQTEESHHKLHISVILTKYEERGRASTQFRDSEKVRVRVSPRVGPNGLCSCPGPKRRNLATNLTFL